MNSYLLVFSMIAVCFTVNVFGDMMRKSIVFDMKTPKVFYCPQEKPTGFDKMIVKAKPLTKLCEYGGQALPKEYKSDCYNDVDESEYACTEKRRIMVMYEIVFEKPQTTLVVYVKKPSYTTKPSKRHDDSVCHYWKETLKTSKEIVGEIPDNNCIIYDFFYNTKGETNDFMAANFFYV